MMMIIIIILFSFFIYYLYQLSRRTNAIPNHQFAQGVLNYQVAIKQPDVLFGIGSRSVYAHPDLRPLPHGTVDGVEIQNDAIVDILGKGTLEEWDCCGMPLAAIAHIIHQPCPTISICSLHC